MELEKSTLLKTISGLYPLSSGHIDTYGKIRSLLDLSLGFELEATGRENILYRCLLLGLKPYHVREKENEIIEFADLGYFIDYPLKSYSAGMKLRLAFAVSSAVSGDILLLDEVIGAGDASFMVKVKKRLAYLIQQSKILMLASHDFNSLESLCQRGIVLHQGKIVFDGTITESIKEYKKINKLF